MVQFYQWKSSNLSRMMSIEGLKRRKKEKYLCISRIRVKNIRKEFTGAGHARDDQPMNVKTIDNEELGKCLTLFLRAQ